MGRVGVHTLLDKELHKAAVVRDVRWSEALEIGVKAVLGLGQEEDLAALRKEADELRARLLFVEKQVVEAEKAEKKRKKALFGLTVMEFEVNNKPARN